MKIGFIGLGRMGKPMTKRLLKKYHALKVYDISISAVEELMNHGAEKAMSPKDLAVDCEIIILMLPNNKAIEDVLIGPEGMYEKLRPNTKIIDMSSSSPIKTKELGKKLAIRNVQMIDAPVSGGIKKAINGELTIMVGGEKPNVESVMPILECFGKKIIHIDQLGSGHASKALNNLLAATSFLALSEVMVAGAKFGVNPDKLLEVINCSSGGGYISNIRFPTILDRDFTVNFTNELMYKDIQTAIDISNEVDSPTFLTSNVEHFFRFAISQLGGQCDYMEDVKLYENWSQHELKGSQVSNV